MVRRDRGPNDPQQSIAAAEKPRISRRMAEGAPIPRRGKSAKPSTAALPIDLPEAMFSGSGLLALADMLPVMTAFVDNDLKYRFINKSLAEWLGGDWRAGERRGAGH